MIREDQKGLPWQSKAILLIVVPWTAVSVVLQSVWWFQHEPSVAWTTLGISAFFGLVVWGLRAGTPAAAATGAAITASLMFSTTYDPYATTWRRGGLIPLLAVFLLTYAATKMGRVSKLHLGAAESKRGRNAAQVAANLGVAALIASIPMQLLSNHAVPSQRTWTFGLLMAIIALSEAAADTVSSEIGQVFGGEPRLITTLKRVPRGIDGGVTLNGSFAGATAAAIVAAVGLCANRGFHLSIWLLSFAVATLCGTLGMLFDSFLGATFERKGWLNNDAVNFLSTASACFFAIAVMILYSYATTFWLR